MNLKLNTYTCGGCNETFTEEGFVKKCEWCGSTLLKKEELDAESYLRWISLELESANHHDYVELPEKLFNRLSKRFQTINKQDLARIICEEFYNNF